MEYKLKILIDKFLIIIKITFFNLNYIKSMNHLPDNMSDVSSKNSI